jgi:hypothetical protein
VIDSEDELPASQNTIPLPQIDPEVLGLPSVPHYEPFRHTAPSHKRQASVPPEFAETVRNNTVTLLAIPS